MPVKTLTHPTTGRTVKLGRNRPEIRIEALALRDYMDMAVLPPAPDCDYSTAASLALGEMYGNDVLGDCVIACAGHLFGVLNENAGAGKALFSPTEIVEEYGVCGYVPGDESTDNGCFVQDVLEAIQTAGMKGHHNPTGHEKIKRVHHISGWLAVDGTNKEEVRQAIHLGENLIFGIELPDRWITPFPSENGFVWDVAGHPDPENGHCVIGCGSTSAGVTIGTWGLVGLMTYAAIARYTAESVGGELYVAFSPESLIRAQQKTPAGIDWETLLSDIAAL